MNVVLMGIVGSSIDDTISFYNEKGMTLKPVVISKSFNKGGSRCNHAHIFKAQI